MFKKYNSNPKGEYVGDCVIRAISKATDLSWDRVYAELAVQGFMMADMPSSDAVWGAVLRQAGYYREAVPNTCPDCYTVADFAADHPEGIFVLALGGHVVTVDQGDWFDTWDSGNEIPQYYFYRKEG